ncbi:hypothetical protein F4779DRAFT_562939 [Xylariaceae sp. FL0662B]|nr:hypothetical protein F4779DRAFT_562939 [Xylariaceae sp. FL0662B]
MAALTEAQIELANSLTQAELPTKLRCAICSKLAVNAFRLPCCETAICETCQSTLPSSCPVCEHSPVSGSDCTVYKSLRTTIKVFLKTEEKKREAARPKTNGSTPSTPVQQTQTPTPTPTQTQAHTEKSAAETVTASQDDVEPPSTEPAVSSTVAESNEPTSLDSEQGTDADPIEKISTDAHSQGHPAEDGDSKALVPNGQEGGDEANPEDGDDDNQGGNDEEQPVQSGIGPGLDSMNGAFNMNFGGGDMNQMQMMMAMQNGMNPAAFGSFPMMGLMDPMAMQSMMMNGGFGVQGMGMNMNLGMNGFNGGSGDWNGQQSWNVGQDNFNPNPASMGNGDFGNFNAGFRTGFPSGNYGHPGQSNDYRRGNHGYRGRGRGRGFYGGYGRGYHQGYNNANTGWAEQNSQFIGGNDTRSVSAGPQATETNSGKVDEFGRTVRPDLKEDAQNSGENGQTEAGGSHRDTAAEAAKNLALENSRLVSNEDGAQSEEAQGISANYNGDVSSTDQRSGSQGPSHESSGPVHPQVTIPDVPLNAPTGPKAMRQGLPNTSLHNLRARGFITDERSSSSGPNPPTVASPLENRPRSRSSSLHSRKDKDRHRHERGREHDDDKTRGRHRDQDRDRSRTYTVSRSRSQSRSRSRSRDRKESRRHRRHRSPSVSDDNRDGDHRHRKYKSRRQSTRDDDDYTGRSRGGDKYNERSRSASPVDRDHKHSSHRGHRDRDEKRRDRDKERDRENDHDRHRKSAHRSHRDRDYDRERERERDKDRGKDRTRDHDEDRHRRSSKISSVMPTPVEPSDKDFNPPTGPRGSFSIKGASTKPSSSGLEIKGASSKSSNVNRRESEPLRRASQSSSAGQKSTPNGTTKDPHTLEREARNRERLLKEAQRIAGLAGRTGVKRTREGGDDRGGRRKSRRSEAVMEDEEGRMKRLEAEREGRRWD